MGERKMKCDDDFKFIIGGLIILARNASSWDQLIGIAEAAHEADGLYVDISEMEYRQEEVAAKVRATAK